MAIDDPQGIRWDCRPCLPLSRAPDRPRNRVIYAALGLPPGGPPRFPDTPRTACPIPHRTKRGGFLPRSKASCRAGSPRQIWQRCARLPNLGSQSFQALRQLCDGTRPRANLCRGGGRWSHAVRSIRCVGGFEIVGPFRDSGIEIALVSPGADAMKLPRRKFLHLASAAAAPAVLRIARAQAYPTRSVRLIAPFPAGGVVDLFSRLIAQPLSERLGQTVIIENRAGAGGTWGPRRPCARRQTATRCFL